VAGTTSLAQPAPAPHLPEIRVVGPAWPAWVHVWLAGTPVGGRYLSRFHGHFSSEHTRWVLNRF